MSHHAQRTGPFRACTRLILASASPRRRELLRALGVEFDVEVSRAAEPAAGDADLPEDYALSNAYLKTMDVAARFSHAAVLGADTIVVIDGKILCKPSDSSHAFRMLSRLCGRRHTVITSCCLVLPRCRCMRRFSSSTDVWLADQARGTVEAYVRSGEPLDKAGSYAVQGCGAFMVERLDGSYTNVVGLPMEKVVPMLLEEHIISVRKN